MSLGWRHGLLAAALVLAAGAGATAGVTAGEPVAAGRTPLPTIQRAQGGGACVAEPAFMRRHHMDLLKHQRNEAVHRGVRDPRSSLQGCIGCHASVQTGSVAKAGGDFCVSCHNYAAVQVDCFGCHASKPQHSAAVPTKAQP